MADRRPLVTVGGQTQQLPAGDKLPIDAIASGTPTGSKFVRDDGVLAVPEGGEGGGGLSSAAVLTLVEYKAGGFDTAAEGEPSLAQVMTYIEYGGAA
jgi:hypothetical protein